MVQGLRFEELVMENQLLKQRLEYLENTLIQKKILEDALEKVELRFETVVSSIDNFYFELDLDGKIVNYSLSGLEGLEKSSHLIIGKTQEELFGKDSAQIHIKNNRKVFNGKKVSYEWKQEINGDERILHSTLSPIRDKKGKIVGIIGVGGDITDKKAMGEYMLKEKKAEMLSLVSGGIAHDFNNILTIINGNCFLGKLSLQQQNYGKLEEIFTELDRASGRARELTERLLVFSKKGSLKTKSLCIKELIQETVDFSLSGSNVTCNYEFEEDLKPIEADETQISQVLNNLVINACQAMNDGGQIDITVKNYTKLRGNKVLPKGEYVHIILKDQGVGISKKNMDKIFDPYFTTKETGNGLGLATAHSIILKHGGYINAESKKGKGTTFHVYLPCSKEEVEAKPYSKENIFYGQGRILIMDDDENVRQVLSKMLKYLGYEVAVTKDGFEAVNTFNTYKENGKNFDIVILDLTIPGGPGATTVIEKLKKIDQDVKAMVISGYSKSNVIKDYQKYGFIGAIYKPFKITVLSKELYKLMNIKDESNGPTTDREISVS